MFILFAIISYISIIDAENCATFFFIIGLYVSSRYLNRLQIESVSSFKFVCSIFKVNCENMHTMFDASR